MMRNRSQFLFFLLFTSTFVFCLIIFFGSRRALIESVENTKKITQLQEAKSNIVYYDEVLTMSARMAAYTGSRKWIERYYLVVEKLDKAIDVAKKLAPSSISYKGAEVTEIANQELIKLEELSFNLVKENQQLKAQGVLLSSEYDRQKEIYSQGMKELDVELEKEIFKLQQTADYNINLTSSLFLILILILILIWWFVVKKLVILQRTLSLQKEREFEQATEMALLGEIAAGIGHDIRSPIAVIVANLNILKNAEKQERHSKSIESIENSLKTMNSMIGNLLSLARNGEEDKVRLEFLEKIVQEALSFSAKRLRLATLDIEKDIVKKYPEDFQIICPKAKLTQVLINLIQNAADAVSDLEEKWIEIDGFIEGNFYFVSVTDSGNGISEDVAEKIFRPQYTTKEEGKGTGLGLSLSYKMVQRLGGELFLDKNYGHTRFVIKLPNHH
ncbi:MAG: GHKL domain-containing protein [Bdellovibrionales bacterium]|nr:GHKL domain-containing protein [Bdellovibrionales bacterium]